MWSILEIKRMHAIIFCELLLLFLYFLPATFVGGSFGMNLNNFLKSIKKCLKLIYLWQTWHNTRRIFWKVVQTVHWDHFSKCIPNFKTPKCYLFLNPVRIHCERQWDHQPFGPNGPESPYKVHQSIWAKKRSHRIPGMEEIRLIIFVYFLFCMFIFSLITN